MNELLRRDCPGRAVLDDVTSRWGFLILLALQPGELRFYQLRNVVEGVSEKMLSQTLRALVRDGLVTRTVEPVVPPRVSYRLTALGEQITAKLLDLTEWIRDNTAAIIAAQNDYDGTQTV